MGGVQLLEQAVVCFTSPLIGQMGCIHADVSFPPAASFRQRLDVMNPAPELQSDAVPEPRKVWKVGTLTYTAGGIVAHLTIHYVNN